MQILRQALPERGRTFSSDLPSLSTSLKMVSRVGRPGRSARRIVPSGSTRRRSSATSCWPGASET